MTSSAHVQGMEWATSICGSVERSRNVIVLSGVLDIEDLERLGINIGCCLWSLAPMEDHHADQSACHPRTAGGNRATPNVGDRGCLSAFPARQAGEPASS
jgi:hypothetical protein